MREILFRGKLKGRKVWAEGNLHIDGKGVCIITPDETVIGKYGQVDPETVGQYIGKPDKRGKKIFEGDILLGAWNTMLVVYYDEDYLQFRVREVLTNLHNDISYYGLDKITVIGNKYDNPELLEVK